ncbi:MAG: bifunctional DNA-formamidopyrimidine glycosylase/DNA-(apurinic or apyrimidinic site) lyase [Candidatus Hodarchaeales archaeon]
MPEGPEVETVRRELSTLVNRKIHRIFLTPLSQKYLKYRDKQEEFDQFKSAVLEEIMRFGKFLVWRFSKPVNPVILNHLGMSGRWILVNDTVKLSYNITHPKVLVEMDQPPHAIFDDIRNFGQFRVFSSLKEVQNYPPIRTLGVDGLKKPFPLETFLELLSKPHYQEKIIGELLLNQKLVAGVGNIYKCESLFKAKLNPKRKVKTLDLVEKTRLGEAIGFILNKALKDGGSTFGSTPYTRPLGDVGNAQSWHHVYGREGLKCKECGSEIVRIIQKDRSTFYCPKCQV